MKKLSIKILLLIAAFSIFLLAFVFWNESRPGGNIGNAWVITRFVVLGFLLPAALILLTRKLEGIGPSAPPVFSHDPIKLIVNVIALGIMLLAISVSIYRGLHANDPAVWSTIIKISLLCFVLILVFLPWKKGKVLEMLQQKETNLTPLSVFVIVLAIVLSFAIAIFIASRL